MYLGVLRDLIQEDLMFVGIVIKYGTVLYSSLSFSPIWARSPAMKSEVNGEHAHQICLMIFLDKTYIFLDHNKQIKYINWSNY